MGTEKKPKIAPVVIKCDGLLVYPYRKVEGDKVTEKGEGVAVHLGETVTILPVQSMAEYLSLVRIQGMSADEADLQQGGDALEELAGHLSKRILSWTWTDMVGVPLESPKDNPKAILALTADEIIFLSAATASGEDKEARKNA
tara:strand:- start:475 stop:903 length:429 start_codon:yes stop_codon:yes gene_type:complete